jgi:hypothetical protein|tara:strand:- start:2655 stop:3707 length:1053 start_codon:yes stop_codon:yes gene_type:complete
MAISNKINQSTDIKKKRFNIKYILAEIFLITAGILIALAIDNWNTDRSEQLMIDKYLIEMHKEYLNEIKFFEKRKDDFKLMLDQNLRALSIIKNSQYDSISVLEELLIGIGNTVIEENEFPITKEFFEQNLLYKIKNERLKNEIKNFPYFLGFNKKINESETDQYVNTIEPFLTDNINYSKICCPNMKAFMVEGGPKTNYKSLMNNMRLWNILSYKRQWLLLNSGMIDGTVYFLKTLIQEITNEIGEELLINSIDFPEFEGIGVMPMKIDGKIKVHSITSDGPASEGGLKKGDEILMVAQSNEDPVDISGMDLFEVMKLISGPKGTSVILTVERNDGTIEDVHVVRGVIK